jgi:hypothetical protein
MAVPTALASLSLPVQPFRIGNVGVAVRLCHVTTRAQKCVFVMHAQNQMQRGVQHGLRAQVTIQNWAVQG